MSLIEQISKFYKKVKDGKKIQEFRFPEPLLNEGEIYHIAGPVDNTTRLLLNNIPKELVDKLIVNKKQILPDKALHYINQDLEEDKESYIKSVNNIKEAYLNREFKINTPKPIHSELFLVPINRSVIKYISNKLDRLDDVEINGSERRVGDLGPSPTDETALDASKRYLSELPFWRLDFFDYSDHLNINIVEREKRIKDVYKVTFEINKVWSKANIGGNGIYRVVYEGIDTIKISGIEKEEPKYK